ncbi:MAG: SDR family NAD(P)-dependent oxidoreductase [Myxococcaceae bacterium]|nr:SDR family NAD(P)-dependent oxidoreductase [Myxococcaceae bacterium]
METKQVVVVTGASTGIGRETALELARRGYSVLAGIRREADAQALRAAAGELSLEPVQLDVSRAEDIDALGRRLDLLPGGLAGLVNNAGHNYNAAFEYSDDERARALMEVNFFGLARLSQRLVPALRRFAESSGTTAKLVNISSVGGSFGLPWEVFYHASKFAVVGLTEGLRQELWRQGIRAVVVQPGGIRTEFMPKTDASIEHALASMPAEGRARYGPGLAQLRSQIAAAGRLGSPPAAVATVVRRILLQQSPRFRWFVGPDARLLYALHAVLPFSWTHALFRRLFGA